jgi:hypothetical protein
MKHNIGDVLATEQLYMRYSNVYSAYRKRKVARVVDDEEEMISL